MIWIFKTVKNRYLNLSAVIKFEDSKGTQIHDMAQNEPKWAEVR